MYDTQMQVFEIIGAGEPCGMFDSWVEILRQANIQAKQMPIADYDRERWYDPEPHPRGNEVYLLVPAENLEDALKILKNLIDTANGQASKV
jgi:hypothetical protein